MRTRYTNRQACSLRFDSAPALLAAVGREAMAGVGLAQPNRPQCVSQTINWLYAGRGMSDITHTGFTPPVTIQSRYRSGHGAGTVLSRG